MFSSIIWSAGPTHSSWQQLFTSLYLSFPLYKWQKGYCSLFSEVFWNPQVLDRYLYHLLNKQDKYLPPLHIREKSEVEKWLFVATMRSIPSVISKHTASTLLHKPEKYSIDMGVLGNVATTVATAKNLSQSSEWQQLKEVIKRLFSSLMQGQERKKILLRYEHPKYYRWTGTLQSLALY